MKKILIAVLALSILLLSLPSVVMAGSQEKKPLTPPELKSITFIHYVKPDKPPKPDKPGDSEEPQLPDPDNSVYQLLGFKLPGATTYYINTSGAPAGAFNEIVASFESWESVTAQDIFNAPQTTNIRSLNYDGQNTISWMKIAPPKTIAVTRLWYTGDTILEYDMAFNSFLSWGVDPDGEGSDVLSNMYDVRNIATHEAGHVLGLADLYEDEYRELTMYGYGRTGETIKISLEEGDVSGAQQLYGKP